MSVLAFCYAVLISFIFAEPAQGYQQEVRAVPDSTFILELLSQANDDINQGRLSVAMAKAQRADSLAELSGYTDGRVISVIRIADVLINQRLLDSAIVILDQALQNYPDSRRMSNFYNLKASAYGYKNENRKSLEMYEESLRYVSRLDSSNRARSRAAIRQNMATAQIDLGDTEAAFQNYLEAVRFAEMTRDTTFWATVLNNIGMAYNDQANYERASYYLEKAMNLSEQKNLKNEIYRTNLNLGNVRLNQDRLDEALVLYNRALELIREIRPGYPPVIVLYNLGRLNGKLGNTELAEEQFSESLDYSLQLGIGQGIYFNNVGLGNLKKEDGQYREAIDHYLTALDTAIQLSNPGNIQEVRQHLYEAYKADGQYENALNYLEVYKQTSDSLNSLEREKALADLESQLELNRQNEINRLLEEKQVQQENKLRTQLYLIFAAVIVIILILLTLYLVRKSEREKGEINEVLLQQKKELEEANRAKDKLFAVIAHDLRSPMSSMKGLLFLIRNSELSKSEMDEFIDELEANVQKNMDVMDDLLAWAREQMAGVNLEVESVRLRSAVDNVLSSQSFQIDKKGLEVRNRVSGTTEVKADKNALQLIIRNLVSNSIKFTEKGGVLSFEAEEAGDHIQFRILDTGTGMSEEVQKRIFTSEALSRAGTQNEKGTGFGLSLSKEFAEKMGGKIWFESKLNEGTTFYIELPKA